MQIGLIRVEALKLMAKTMKKRIDTCGHSLALERLSRSCGLKDYHHVLNASSAGVAETALLPGCRDELIQVWTVRICTEFSIDVDTVFSEAEISTWFDRVFVPRECLVTDMNRLEIFSEQVVDPQLKASQWNDAEFRQGLLRDIDRNMN